MSSTANMMRPMPSVFTGAFSGPARTAFGVWNLDNSSRLWPSGVRSIAMSARRPSSPTTRSAQRPSMRVSPSSSIPSSTKNAVAAARSSTMMPTLSIRRIVIYSPMEWPGRSPPHSGAFAARIVGAGREREPDRERAAAPHLAVDRDRATVLAHDLVGAGQSEAIAGNAPRHVAAAMEPLKQPGQVVGGDAQPSIAHAEVCPNAGLVFHGGERDVHRPTVRAVLDRVGEQVAQDLLQAVGIPAPDEHAVPLARDAQPVLVGRGRVLRDEALGAQHQVHVAALQ